MSAEREHFRIEEMAPGVHAAIATAEGYGLCNSGIVDLGGTRIVFDGMLTPQAGEALGIAARRLTGGPIDFLVNSHYHGDHVRGNGAVAARHILSTHRVRDLIVERSSAAIASDRAEAAVELKKLRSGETPATPAERAVFEGWFEGVLATPPDWSVTPPDVTIADEVVLLGSRRRARIVSFGGGHSPSDVLVHLPDDGIVFLGDLLSIGFHPCLWDGDPDGLVRILGEIRALRPDRALPGHGPIGGLPELLLMEEYVATLRRLGREGREERRSTDPAPSSAPPPPFDAWKFRSFFEQNLAFVTSHAAAATG
ncbi:MAG TPA: MBL fold metallo-hydrolase [Thermoplasmata archaeon]|nr:MBL fold metallo-hydrolase [Thermoplasmata archaeon]